jgi:RNA polymerase sigma-70 factor (sigma-E family)
LHGCDTAGTKRGRGFASLLDMTAYAPDAIGARDDFSEYVAARRTTLLRAACQLTPNPADAEDLLQEGLVKVYGAWNRIADKRVAHAYVRRTMSNHQISQWRRHRVEEYPASDELPDSPVWDSDTDRVELRTVLHGALAALPHRDRQVLALRYYGSYTDSEIAERLGMSIGTVKSTLWRALRKLRENGAVRTLHADLVAA